VTVPIPFIGCRCCNIYVLKQVLHDWDDPRASTILQSCRKVMTPGTKLLVVELVIPEAGPAALLGSLIDLHMLVMHSGRERTADEFSRLCGTAGFKLTRIVATGTPICIIEGVPI
jgi:O-methyltransferase domain